MLIAALVLARTANATPPLAGPACAQSGDPIASFIAEAAHQFSVPASWIRAVMRVESGGNVREISPKGAMGLMQIMPETWADLRVRYNLGADPFDAHDNILAGAAYLRALHDRYGARGFLAAYNAGPARYEDHLATGRPLPDETRAYVAQLAPMVVGDHVDGAVDAAVPARSWIDAPLFPVHATTGLPTSRRASGLRDGSASTDAATRDLTTLAPRSDGLFVRIAQHDAKP
jgi:hypothetical protein